MGATNGTELENLETVKYTWREVVLPTQATCFDIQGSDSIDLAVGTANGSILVYQNVLETLFGKGSDKKSSPRKLHWHREACNTLRWSKDGVYSHINNINKTLRECR